MIVNSKRIVLLLCMTAVTYFVQAQEDSLSVKIKTPIKVGSFLRVKPQLSIKEERIPSYNQVDGYTTHQMFDMNQLLPQKKQPPRRKFYDSPYFNYAIPATLISYGLVAQHNKALQQLDTSTTHEVNEHYTGNFPLDDYLQYAPYAAYYGLDLCGIKAKHNVRDRTITLISSYVIMSSSVHLMKRGFGRERPNGSSHTSFPSGHTATAFLGAHLLFKEYKDTAPLIGVAGYLSAITVGCLRVRNNRHWVSDVVAGAGVGMLSAEIGYLLLPLSHKLFRIKDNNKAIVFSHLIENEGYGMSFAYSF